LTWRKNIIIIRTVVPSLLNYIIIEIIIFIISIIIIIIIFSKISN